MNITELYQNLPLIENRPFKYIGRDGDVFSKSESILTEHAIDVYINERLTMKLICIPEHLTELVLGRLLTEGIIRSASDVEQIYICEFGKRARVFLSCECEKNSSPASDDFVEITPSCCTGNHILNDYFLHSMDMKPVIPIDWKPDWIFNLADCFADGMPLHSQTFATHSCFLAMQDQILFRCEDLGRHNALDKVIGYALRHNINLRECIIYSSGRIPTDMVMKAIRSGIPVLASKASPTAEAIAFAKEYQLTLICAARRDRMKVFS